MNKLYLEDLKGFTEEQIREHLLEEYEASINELDKYEILVAYESVGNWGCDSTSFFLLKEKTTGEYFMIFGSHCSCKGFEGQFEPEKTTIEFLKSKHFNMWTCGYDSNSEENERLVIEYMKNIKEEVIENTNNTENLSSTKINTCKRKITIIDEED